MKKKAVTVTLPAPHKAQIKCKFKGCKNEILKNSQTLIGEPPFWVKKMFEGYFMEHAMFLFKEEEEE